MSVEGSFVERPRIVFPKPLAELKTDTVIDETGFTASEKVALQNAWRVIRRRFRHHSSIIFLDFFTANETLLEDFRGPDGKFNLNSLHQHPQSVLRIFGRLTEGLNVPTMIYIILTEVVQQHRKYHVNIDVVQLLTFAVRDYLQDALRAISSPTFILALDKLCKIIIDFHANCE